MTVYPYQSSAGSALLEYRDARIISYKLFRVSRSTALKQRNTVPGEVTCAGRVPRRGMNDILKRKLRASLNKFNKRRSQARSQTARMLKGTAAKTYSFPDSCRIDRPKLLQL